MAPKSKHDSTGGVEKETHESFKLLKHVYVEEVHNIRFMKQSGQ